MPLKFTERKMASVEISTHSLSNRVKKKLVLNALFLFILMGLLSLSILNTAFATQYTHEFCTACHQEEKEKEIENAKKLSKQTIHHARQGDVPADCLDCHIISFPLIHKISYELQASTESLYKIIGAINNTEQLEPKRLRLAKNIWKKMKENNSQACRVCHTEKAMNPEFQKPESQKQHLSAQQSGKTCIDCHKSIAHHISTEQFTKE